MPKDTVFPNLSHSFLQDIGQSDIPGTAKRNGKQEDKGDAEGMGFRPDVSLLVDDAAAFQSGMIQNPIAAGQLSDRLDVWNEGSSDVTALTSEIAHIEGCPCGSCAMKEESNTLGDLADGDDTVTGEATASAPALLGDMAEFLVTGFWGSSRFHNVTDSGFDPNNGVLTFNVSGYSTDVDGISAERAELVREAFKLFEATLGIQFQETTSTDTSEVDFFFSDNSSGAYAGSSIYSNGEISYSYINIAESWSGGTSTYDDYTFQTILHEIGHALGLGHQGAYNGSATYGVDNTFENDSWQASMMSYFSQTENTSIDASYEFLQTPMSVDWMALDLIYGAQGYGTENAFTEDTVWGFNTTITSDVSDVWANFSSYANRTASTIVDGGGMDTLDLSGYANNTLINLAPSDSGSSMPSLSNIGGRIGNLSIAEGTIIENAIGGAGAEVFFGNAADNHLTGNGGNDTFVDSAGSDTYIGGVDEDTVIFEGAFSNYSFNIAGVFLEVINVVIDLVDITIEWLTFADNTYSWQDVADTVGTPNTAPVAVADTATTTEDGSTSGNLLANDSDLDGDSLSVSAVNGQTANVGGIIALASGAQLIVAADGTFDYNPNGVFDFLSTGQTAADSFTYTISDGRGGSETANVTVEIQGRSSAPVANDDTDTLSETTQAAGNVLANDSDGDGDALSVVAVNGQSAAVGQQITLASGATLTLNADGSYDYDPNGAFDALAAGDTATDSFSYTISDGNGGTDVATMTLSIAGEDPAPEETPVLIDFEAEAPGTYFGADGVDVTGLTVQSGTTLDGTKYAQTDGFTVSGEDFDLDAISMESAGGRVRVRIEAYDDGVLVATATVNTRSNRTSEMSFGPEFDSVDEVRFTSNGTFNVDNLSLVTRTVVDPNGNNTPNATNDTIATGEAQIASINLLDNDSDPDGDAIQLTSVNGDNSGTVTLDSGAIVTFAADGTATYDPNGAFDALYDGQQGTDSFAYTVEDGQGGVDQAVATVTIAGSGTPPPAPSEYQIGFEGAAVAGVLIEDEFNFQGVTTTTQSLGVSSGQQAGQSLADSITITREDGANFDFESAVMTALNGKNVRLTAEAYDDGVLIGSEQIRLRDNRETQVNFDDGLFDSVDQVVLTAQNGFILDDVFLIA